jgi:hypothetical protein
LECDWLEIVALIPVGCGDLFDFSLARLPRMPYERIRVKK